MTGQAAAQAGSPDQQFPQVRPLDVRGRPAASSPVQGEPGGETGRLDGGLRSSPRRPASADTPPCARGPAAGHRILPGQHQPDCPRPCDGCLPCPQPHCATCRRRHSDDTCPPCLSLARLNLGSLLILVAALPSQAANGRQAYHQGDEVPGGDATVMLAPASPHWPPGWTGAVNQELPSDPRPPLDVLTHWANVWRDRQQQPTALPPTMDRACDYLADQLHRIARHALFPHLAHDLARLLHSVENVVHAGHRPDLSRVPCWDCGARLVKVWADQARHDHWRCPACGEVYDQGRYELAEHDHLHSTGAARFVPLTDAVAVTGRPEQTVRAWARDGLVESRRTAGRVEVWWPDVRDRHRVTPQRNRGRTP